MKKLLYYKDNKKIDENAEFVLTEIAGAKKGDNIVVIADSVSYVNGRALCDCAIMHGMNAMIIDIDMYGGKAGYMKLPVMDPLKHAILNSDIAFMVTDQMKTDFGRFLGNRDECDTALLGHNKRFTFEANGMAEWDLNREEVLLNRKRTLALFEWLKRAKTLHITTKRGTDLLCRIRDSIDGMYPVMAIIPFYSEIAIIPSINSVNGIAVIDGASQCAYDQRGFPIRPNRPGYQEIYKEPLELVFKDSMLTDYQGDPVQTGRLTQLLNSVDPKPDICDEIGIVTTTSIENDIYGWLIDGTHQTGCLHVALGNNRRRKEIIHSTEHVDFDMHDPAIEVDGIIIYKDSRFNDEAIFKMAADCRKQEHDTKVTG